MADIATYWVTNGGWGDWLVTPSQEGDISDENGSPILDSSGDVINDGLFTGGSIMIGNDLGTAILISIFSDRTAGTDDIIPDGSGDPRGWWGDLDAAYPIGSKLWLRARSKQTDLVLALVKNDIADALQWLLDDKVAASIDVTTEWTRRGMLGARIVVNRNDGTSQSVRFDWAWKELE
jgi:phage gp46-like protein